MLGKLYRMIDKVLTIFEEWTLFITVLAALISLFFNVVLRYGFNYSLSWSEELVRDVIIYTTFIGTSAAIRKRLMIRIDATVQIFHFLKKPLTLFSHLATLAFSGILIYYGWKMALLQLQTGQKTIILQIPLVWLYSVLPLTGIMMVFRTLQVTFEDFIRPRRSK